MILHSSFTMLGNKKGQWGVILLTLFLILTMIFLYRYITYPEIFVSESELFKRWLAEKTWYRNDCCTKIDERGEPYGHCIIVVTPFPLKTINISGPITKWNDTLYCWWDKIEILE